MCTPMTGSESDPLNPPASGETDEVHRALSREWPVVMVVWIDAEAKGGPGWEDAEDLVEFAVKPLAEVRTVGMMIYACEQFVALTESRGPDQIGVVQKIPKAWIVSMELLVPSEDVLPPTLSIGDVRAG